MTRQEEIVMARMVSMKTKVDTFEKATLLKMSRYYELAMKDLVKQIKAAQKNTGRIWTNSRLITMLEEVQVMHTVVVDKVADMTVESTVLAGQYSYEQMNNIISWDGKVQNFNSIALAPNQMAAMVQNVKMGGKNIVDWVGSALRPDFVKMKDEMLAGYVQGKSNEKIIAQLSKSLDIPRGTKQFRDMETVVKTYIQGINTKAQIDVYEANQDVVKQVEWSAIMENGNTKTGRGTCPRCAALDGMRWKTTDYDRPACPLHGRCRCMLYPVTITWDELGFDGGEMKDVYNQWTIRNLNSSQREILEYGDIDGNYADWWATKGKKFQNNAIGPVRADLVRRDVIKFQDIVDDKTGKLILIKDLPGYVPPKTKPPKTKKAKKTKKAATPAVSIPKRNSDGLTLPVQGTAAYVDAAQAHQITSHIKDYLKQDAGYTMMERGHAEWGSGAFHSEWLSMINMGTMDKKLDSLNTGTTFIHEFGHRTDFYYGKEFTNPQKWGNAKLSKNSIGKGYVSSSKTYWDSMLQDQKDLGKVYNSKFKEWGGTGAASRRKVLLQMDVKARDFDDAMGSKGIFLEEDVSAAIRKEGVSDKWKPFLNLTNQLADALPINSTTTDILYKMYRSIRLADIHDYPGWIMDDWLRYANHVGHSGTGIHGSLSDMVGATTKEKWGLGHGLQYYKVRPQQRSKEAFAQIFATYGDQDALAVIRMLAPGQLSIFEQFLKETTK